MRGTVRDNTNQLTLKQFWFLEAAASSKEATVMVSASRVQFVLCCDIEQTPSLARCLLVQSPVWNSSTWRGLSLNFKDVNTLLTKQKACLCLSSVGKPSHFGTNMSSSQESSDPTCRLNPANYFSIQKCIVGYLADTTQSSLQSSDSLLPQLVCFEISAHTKGLHVSKYKEWKAIDCSHTPALLSAICAA